MPDRDAAIAIVRRGLGVSDTRQVNALIGLLAYDPLTAEESQRLDLALAEANTPTVATETAETDSRRTFAGNQRGHAWAVGLTVGSIALSVVIAWLRGGQWIWIATSALYAGLYAESLFLETAYAPGRRRTVPAAIILFGFMLLTSVIALAVDVLLVSLVIFVVAAVAQWIAVRPILPEAALVPTRFQSHTAQTAHLKNTFYFLFIVVFFWLPPAHCVSVLRQQIKLGHGAMVRDLLGSGWIVVTQDVVCLSTKWMWVAFVVLVPVAMGLGAHLLENLRNSPKLNPYTTLLYLRAGLYLSLCLLCTGWYSYAVERLLA